VVGAVLGTDLQILLLRRLVAQVVVAQVVQPRL
jgi:hypothetical protein